MNNKKYQKELELFNRLTEAQKLESEIFIYNMRIINKVLLK